MKQRYCFLLAYFLIGYALPISAQQYITVEKPDTLELDPSVRYGKLENGFTYYIRHNDEPENEVHFQMVVKAGYHHEDSLQLEYAHLLEHMGATGTQHFPDLKNHISLLGGYSHANTAGLFTWYWARISSGNDTLFKDGLQIIADWAQGINLNSPSIDVERGAVLGEMRTTNPYRQWTYDVIDQIVERHTGYQTVDREKNAANIRHFNREAFVRFYKEWYRPDLQAAVVVGDINVDSMEREIKRLFADLKMPKNPTNASAPVLAHGAILDGKNRYAVQVDSINREPRLYIVPKRINPSYSPKTHTDYKTRLIQQVYQRILNVRMNNLGQKGTTLFSLMPSYFADQQLYAMRISVVFRDTSLSSMERKFLQSLAGFRSVNSGFSERELTDAKVKTLEMYPENQIRSTKALAVKYRDHFVLGTAAPDPNKERELLINLLDDIGLEDIQRAADVYGDLKSNTNFLFLKGPETTVPDSIKLQEWLSEAFTQEVEPFTPIPLVTSLEDVVELPDAAANPIERISKNVVGVTTVDLVNGVRLLIKPTDNGNNVRIRASRPNHVPFDNRQEYLAAVLAPDAIQFVGAGPYTRFQLRPFTGGTDLHLFQRLDRMEQVIVGSSRSDRMEEFLQLLYLYTQQPRMDEQAFEDWIAREQRWIKEGHPDKNMFFTSAIDQIRFPKLPFPKARDLDQLSMESIYAAHERWYSNFGGYTFVITGGFNIDELLPLLVRYLSVLPEGKILDTRELEVPIIVPLEKLNVTKHIVNTNRADVFLHFPVIAPTDTKTKVLVNLLSNALYSRIWDRLRKGSYSPSSRADLVDFNRGVYEFKVWFDAELGEQDTLIKWTLEEFRNLRDHGVDREWFEKNLSKRVSNYDITYNSGYFWNTYLSEKTGSGESMTNEILEYQTMLKHFVSLEDLNKAAKELLSEKYLQKFVFLPNEIASD